MAPQMHVPTSKILSATEKLQHKRANEKPGKAQILANRNQYRSAASLLELRQEFSTDLQMIFFRVLHMQGFEYGMGLVILLNFVVVVIETDKVANKEENPAWIDASGWLVLLIFVVELIMRLYVLRWEFFHEAWNIFDFFIVSVDSLMSVLGLIFGSLFPVSALRILRLCKLARVSKVFRVFPELREMLAGLVGSLRAILWGSVLLLVALLVCGVLAVQFIHPINERVAESGRYDSVGCLDCAEAFSSVAEATLTFSQQIVAGDSWGQVTIPIIHESPISSLFFAAVFVCIGMAVLNLILGVVVNVATQAHDSLATEIEDESLVKRMEVHGHLLQICAEMDSDQSGELSKTELFDGYKANAGFRKTLGDMDIVEEDLEILWTVLDSDKSGSICYNEFVSHCYRMKLSDTQFMLAYIKFYITVIKDKICENVNEMRDAVEASQQKLSAEVMKIEAEEEEFMQKEADFMRETAKAEEDLINVEKDEMDMLKSAVVAGNQAAARDENMLREVREIATKVNDVGGKPTDLKQALTQRPSGDVAMDSQMYRLYSDMLEEARQQREDLRNGMCEIKSRLDLYLPPVSSPMQRNMEPKLNGPRRNREPGASQWNVEASPATPRIPGSAWSGGCCQSKPPVTITEVPVDSNWSTEPPGPATPRSVKNKTGPNQSLE